MGTQYDRHSVGIRLLGTYLRFREIIEDKAQISIPYSTWVADSQKKIDALAKKGVFLIKINADPDEFVAWCKVNAYPPNQQARMRFAVIKYAANMGYG
jgi:hypothetical protein